MNHPCLISILDSIYSKQTRLSGVSPAPDADAARTPIAVATKSRNRFAVTRNFMLAFAKTAAGVRCGISCLLISAEIDCTDASVSLQSAKNGSYRITAYWPCLFGCCLALYVAHTHFSVCCWECCIIPSHRTYHWVLGNIKLLQSLLTSLITSREGNGKRYAYAERFKQLDYIVKISIVYLFIYVSGNSRAGICVHFSEGRIETSEVEICVIDIYYHFCPLHSNAYIMTMTEKTE